MPSWVHDFLLPFLAGSLIVASLICFTIWALSLGDRDDSNG